MSQQPIALFITVGDDGDVYLNDQLLGYSRQYTKPHRAAEAVVIELADILRERLGWSQTDPRWEGLMASDLYVLSPVDTNQIPGDLAYEIKLHPQPPIRVYLASRDGQPPIGYVVRFPLNTLAWASCLVCMLIPGADASAINQALDRLVDPCQPKEPPCPMT